MKILAISTWFPFPPDNGVKARNYHLLNYLGKRHTLDLISVSQHRRDEGYLDELKKFCRRVATFPARKFDPDEVRSWREFFSATPRGFMLRHSMEMEALAARWTAEERYDAALAASLGAAPYIADLNIPLRVLDQHNVESQVIKRRWQGERSILRRLRYAPTWIKAERFERQLASRFDLITTVSEHDRRLMERLFRGRFAGDMQVVPNGADPALLGYASPERRPNVLVSTGALTYQPNYDAAVILCREILPAVRERHLDTRLIVTGRCDGVDISGLARTPGVEFTGYVEDIRPVVASASALVVPLRFGGGTRLKILEAMALGTPVVSTPIGAEGLEVADGTHILMGETSSELAARISALLEDAALAERISGAARALIEERYLWPAIAENLEHMLVNGLEQERVEACTSTRTG